MPALTLILDLPVTAGLQRANKRRGVVEKTDTFEAEAVDFHERVRAGFLAVANAQPERVCLINADRSVEMVHQEILAIVWQRMREMKRETPSVIRNLAARLLTFHV